MRLMEETGIVFHHQEVLEIFKRHGLPVEGHIVYFPPQTVEESLKSVPSKFKWQARNEKHSVMVGQDPLLQPAAGPVFVHSLDSGRRTATLEDYRNFQKIYQAEGIFDLVGMIPCEPADVPQDRKHLLMMFEILKHTDKPVNGFMTTGRQVRVQRDMMASPAR